MDPADCPIASTPTPDDDDDNGDPPVIRIYRYIRDSTLTLLKGFFGSSQEVGTGAEDYNSY